MFVIKLTKARSRRRPNGMIEMLGYPLPPGDNFVCELHPVLGTTGLPDRAVKFRSREAAQATADLISGYEAEIVSAL